MNQLVRLLISLLIPCALAAQPNNQSVHAQLSQWLQEGNWDAVINSPTDTSDIYILSAIAYAHYQSGNSTIALERFTEVLGIDSNNRQALYYTAIINKAASHNAEAIPFLKRLCTIAPEVPSYHILLSDSYNSIKDPASALPEIRRAYSLSQQPAIAGKLVSTLINLKRYDTAGYVLNAALGMSPGNPLLFSTAITLAYQQKHYAQVAAFTDSLILTGKLNYNSLLAGIYADMATKNYDHVLHIADLLIPLADEPDEVLYYAALAHQHLKHYKDSEALLHKCITKALKPNLEAYYSALGETAALQKQYIRSASYHDTAWYLFKSPTELYMKGVALENSGNKPAAKQAFKRYLSLPATTQNKEVVAYLKAKGY